MLIDGRPPWAAMRRTNVHGDDGERGASGGGTRDATVTSVGPAAAAFPAAGEARANTAAAGY